MQKVPQIYPRVLTPPAMMMPPFPPLFPPLFCDQLKPKMPKKLLFDINYKYSRDMLLKLNPTRHQLPTEILDVGVDYDFERANNQFEKALNIENEKILQNHEESKGKNEENKKKVKHDFRFKSAERKQERRRKG